MAISEAIERSVRAAHAAVLVVSDAAHAVLRVTGEDRISWLNGLVTCDLAAAKEGDAAYGLAVSPKGRIIADLTVVPRENDALVVLPRSTIDEVRTSLEHYLVMEDAEIVAESEPFSLFFAHGPRSPEVLMAARAAGGHGGIVDSTGLGGAIVIADALHVNAVKSAMGDAVTRLGGAMGDDAMGDDAAWEVLRIERQVVKFGAEFDAKTYPQEASLEQRAVSFSKGCYLGQEVVCMLELRGHVKRKIVGLRLSSGVIPPVGSSVTTEDGAIVGAITSACWSPTASAVLALAMIKRASSEVGTSLRVDAGEAKVVAP